jgi:hypothetical protein
LASSESFCAGKLPKKHQHGKIHIQHGHFTGITNQPLLVSFLPFLPLVL